MNDAIRGTGATGPEAHFTRIEGSKLWHLALLEWWLRVMWMV